ncbi:hypothetical protein P692DRAFT_20880767, partial [Suillus brevipes Sb2]
SPPHTPPPQRLSLEPLTPTPPSAPPSAPPAAPTPPASPTPPAPPAPPVDDYQRHNLFVRGTTHKAPSPMTDVEIVEGPAPEAAPSRKRKEPSPEVQIIESPAPQASPEPAPKRRKVAKRAPRQKVKSKEVVVEDEEDPPADKVIWVKKKQPEAGSSKPVVDEPAQSDVTELTRSMPEDLDSGAQQSTLRLFPSPCERCIRDDAPCETSLDKKTLVDVCKTCLRCSVKKSKCVHPSAERVEELHVAVALKKSKASAAVTKRTTRATKPPAKAPAPAPPRSRATARPDTRAASKKRATSPPAPSSDEDAEGDEDPEVEKVAIEVERPERDAPVDDVPAPFADVPAPLDDAPAPAANVDNDVDMDFAVPAPLPEPQASPEVTMAELPQPSVQLPSTLDLLHSIEALGKKFDAMLQTSGDRAEVLHSQMEAQVDAMDDQWNRKFAEMEDKICRVELKSSIHTATLGHMAGAIKVFQRSGKLPAFDPPALPSLSLPFGSLPISWLPQVGDANQAGEPSVSTIGRELTTVWDESRAPVVSTPGDASASAVHPSGDAPQVSQASTLSTAPSGSVTKTQ